MRIRNTYWLGIIFLSISLQACFITPKYERPEIITEQAYRNSPIDDTTNFAQIIWSDFFNDPLLNSYIDKGLKQNQDYLTAYNNVEIARQYVQQANANYLPTVNAQLNTTKMTPSLNSFQGRLVPSRLWVNDITLGLNLNWELDIWGKLRSQKKAAVAGYMAQMNAQQAYKSLLVSNIARYYFTLINLDNKKTIVEQTILNREQGVETIIALKDAGSVTQVAVEQNIALFLNAKAILVDIKNQIYITENALSILIGEAPSSIERSQVNLSFLETEIKQGVPIQLLSNRPDVMAAEFQLIQAFQLTNAARASFYPTLSITGSGGLDSRNFSNLFSLNSLFANVAGSLVQPIFNRRLLKTQYKVSQLQQENALLAYQKSVLVAYQEVADAMNIYQANQEKLTYKMQEQEALLRAVEYSVELQNQGMASYLEVITAQNNALNASLSVHDVAFQKLNATITLYRALGGGWKE